MRYLVLILLLCAFSPIFPKHDTADKIDQEFSNAEQNLQDQAFTVLPSTPNLQDLKDGQFVIVSSNSAVRIMFRQGQEIYSVTASCVTVR